MGIWATDSGRAALPRRANGAFKGVGLGIRVSCVHCRHLSLLARCWRHGEALRLQRKRPQRKKKPWTGAALHRSGVLSHASLTGRHSVVCACPVCGCKHMDRRHKHDGASQMPQRSGMLATGRWPLAALCCSAPYAWPSHLCAAGLCSRVPCNGSLASIPPLTLAKAWRSTKPRHPATITIVTQCNMFRWGCRL
jgi:hypothetical protein